MKRRDIVLICLLFLFAFLLRFYDISYPDFRWMDEQGHVPAATNYWARGQFEPDNWEHPPLRHIMLYGFLKAFGDNPYGWRMRNVLFGAAAAVLTALLAFSVSGSRKAAALAGLLLATDPLHIVLSRYTFEEIYGGAFFLAAIVLFLMHKGRSSWFVMSAFFMGCALATKWYYVPVWIIITVLALFENKNYRKPGNVFFVASTYLLVPLIVYVLSYFIWFGRGYSIGEFVEFTVNAYYALQSFKPESYSAELFFVSHSSASEWFLKPVMVGQGTYQSAEQGEFILYTNNLPVWILTIPSLIAMSIVAVRKRAKILGLPALFFCATYVLFLFVKRPAFIYSAAPLLPFAFTAIAYAIVRLTERNGVRLYYAPLVVMVAWNLYLYPLVTAKKVPVALYSYILNKADVKIH